MAAGFYKPKNSPYFRMDIWVKGKHYRESTGCTSRRDAEAYVANFRRDLALGRRGAVAQMTLDAACGRYWVEVGQHRGDSVDVERRIGKLIDLLGAATPLGRIGHAEVYATVQKRRSQTFTKGKDRRGKDGQLIPAKRYRVSVATVNRDVKETLRPILTLARTHWTPTGQTHGLPDIDWKKLHLTEPKPLNQEYGPEEVRRWIEEAAAWGDDLDLAAELLLTRGWRFGELFFPLDAPRLLEDGPCIVLQKGRKMDVHLRSPITDDQFRRIMARVTRARAAGLNQIWFYQQGTEQGIKLKAYTRHQIEYRLSKAADRAGITAARRIHGARHHTGNRVAARAGILAVKDALGHADIKSSQRYARTSPTILRAALDDTNPPTIPPPESPQGKKAQST